MAKVHPSAAAAAACTGGGGVRPAAVLTVWRRSLLFNGNGFAVFDAKGNLVFRVDNYASGSKAEVLLMDAAGKPLLTIRRKVFLKHGFSQLHSVFITLLTLRRTDETFLFVSLFSFPFPKGSTQIFEIEDQKRKAKIMNSLVDRSYLHRLP